MDRVIQRGNVTQLTLIVCALILFVIIVLLWRQNRKITRINSANESALRQAQDEVLYLSEEIENLAYSVSHDLNAPLRAVEGFSRILQRDYQDRIDEEGGEFLGLIHDNAQQLKALLDGVLKYSRLGRKTLNIASLNLNALTDEVIKELNPVLIKSECILVAPLPEIQGDKELIRQLLTILMRNAVTFSRTCPEPHIHIDSRDEEKFIHLVIRDNGIGFEPGYEDKMFGLFQKLHSEKDGSGLGIGLALAKRIVHRHRGSIRAEGNANEGAIVTVMLPKNQQHAPIERIIPEQI